jgi:hypothetical protein
MFFVFLWTTGLYQNLVRRSRHFAVTEIVMSSIILERLCSFHAAVILKMIVGSVAWNDATLAASAPLPA